MPKPSRRIPRTNEESWRKPEYESHINKYPFGLASLIGGAAAALIGLMISFVVVVAIWLLAAHGTESTIQVVRASAITWQATHLVPISIGSIPVGILPWGFLFIPAFIIWKTMHWTLKSALPTKGKQFWVIAIFFSFIYSLISLLVSLLCSTDGLATSFIFSFLHSFFISFFVSILVLLDYAPSPKVLIEKIPQDLVISFKPGLIAFMTMWLISGVLTTLALMFRWNEVKAVAGLMAPSSIDQAFLTILSIGYLPTVITWVFAYALGAGIHLGGSAIISYELATPGALPAFPLLSILPSTSMPIAKSVLLVPILAGVVIYFLIPRLPWKSIGQTGLEVFSNIVRISEVVRITLGTLVLGVAAFIVTSFSSGPLGVGYLSFIGPDPVESFIWVFKISGTSALLMLLLPRAVLSGLYWWTNRPRAEKFDSVD